MKAFFFVLSFAIISYQLPAQRRPVKSTRVNNSQTTLAVQLQELVLLAESKFESIKGEENKSETKTNMMGIGNYVYNTSYQLKGAASCRVIFRKYTTQVLNKTRYAAIYVDNGHEAWGTGVFNDLSDKIQKGLSDKFSFSKQDGSYGSEFHVFSPKEKSDHKINLILAFRDVAGIKKAIVTIEVF